MPDGGPSSITVAPCSGRSAPPVAPQPASASVVAKATSVRNLGDDETDMAAVRTTREEEVIEERGAAAYTAEFLGTFMLVFFICMIVIVQSPRGVGVTDWIVIGFVH